MKKINHNDIEFLLKKIKDPQIRAKLTRENHFLFFHIYFGSYVTKRMAPFHREIFAITEDEKNPLAVICAFRGSGKSTLISLSYALWSILGVQEKKFVVIIGQTQDQAGQLFKNIKKELEGNTLLKADLGPFKEDEWHAGSLVLPKYNARITVASTEQSIRGIRHGSYRPDLILCDDLEDSNSVKTREGRDKTYNCFTREILPLGDTNTRTIVVGNLLHRESLIMKLAQEIEKGKRSGIFRRYPLVNDEGKCLWLGKYPNKKAIEKEREKIGSDIAFAQEFLLIIRDEHEAIINEDQIHHYDSIPDPRRGESFFYAIGVDLAASQEEKSNYTAMVSAKIIGSGDDLKVYILPNPINEKLKFPEIIKNLEILVANFGGKLSAKIYVEDVVTQKYVIQQLEDKDFQAEGVKIHGMNKRERLIMSSNWIISRVFFPKHGCEELEKQITGFGIERYTDLLDALTTLILKLIDKGGNSDTPLIVKSIGMYDNYTSKKRRLRTREDWDRFIDEETRREFSLQI